MKLETQTRWALSLFSLVLVLTLTSVAVAEDNEAQETQEESAQTNDHDATYVPSDVHPSIELFRSGDRYLNLGASLQIYAVPFIQEEALTTNGDGANEEGFRLRRARLGVTAGLFKDVSFSLVLDPTDVDHLIHNASLKWSIHSAFTLNVGATKVPYSRSAVESSGRLHFVDRPLATGDLGIGERLGLTIEGRLWNGALGYVAGVYNATDGFSIGNQSDGILYGGRIESAPMGPVADLCPTDFRIQLGGGALMEDGPTVDTFAASGDLHLEAPYVRMRGEFLYDKRSPDAAPLLAPTLSGEVERFVIVGELTGFVLKDQLELAARYEWYDNNSNAEDFGDQQLITGGINYYIDGHHLKILANYIYRDELAGRDIANDAVIISIVGAL